MQNLIARAYSFPQRRRMGAIILLTALCIIIGTGLRLSLLFIYPPVVLAIASYYNFKITAPFLIVAATATLSFLLSLYPHPFLSFKLLSLYYMIPFLYLLFARADTRRDPEIYHTPLFFSCLAAIALIDDVIGIVQVILRPKSDDSFIGLYTNYSISMNGLMLINALLFYHYFVLFLSQRKTTHLFLFIFFLACATLSFYGAGLIIFIVAFALSFLSLNVKSVVRTLAIALISTIALYFSMLAIKPNVVDYNLSNIKKLAGRDMYEFPRKLLSFHNYATSYPKDAKDFIFGSGPGTFNSRTAFMLGSPSYFNTLPFIKSEKQPYYFKNYAYTLWNEENTSQLLFMDGFRNQPFSSILAFFGEYGLLFTATFFLFYFVRYRSISKLFRSRQKKLDDTITPGFRLFKFLTIFLPFLLLIDNYLEIPEIMLLLLVGLKLSERDILLKLKSNGNITRHSRQIATK